VVLQYHHYDTLTNPRTWLNFGLRLLSTASVLFDSLEVTSGVCYPPIVLTSGVCYCATVAIVLTSGVCYSPIVLTPGVCYSPIVLTPVALDTLYVGMW